VSENVPDAEWVDRPEDLARVAREVGGAARVAIDTESNSLHAYRERTCIVQLTVSADDGPERTAILDPLALRNLDPLRGALDRDDLLVVFHGGDYDVAVLDRDHGIRFRRVFDTMIAATLLGEPKVGLADLVARETGATLNKRFQKADWARRPLTREHLEYLRGDTAHLLTLHDRFRDRLVAADLVEEAEIEFARLALRRGREAVFDPEGWRRLDGAGRLGPEGRTVLRELFLWRDEEAERRDVPPFHVVSPRTLVDLAARPPLTPADLRDLPPALRRRHGREVLDVVRDALDAAAEGDVPPADARPRPTPEEKARLAVRRRREDALRDFRRQEAAARGVPNVVVLPNPALEWLLDASARGSPLTSADLDACRDLGPRRALRYGGTILAILSS
jgi:ribonuclease D